jgi:hypothetical protein
MTPETAFLARMMEVAPDDADRMYLGKGPQQPVLPVAIVLLIDDIRDSHLRGGQWHGRARIQLDVYMAEASDVDSYAEANTFYERLHGVEDGSALAGYRGHVGGTPGGMFIEEIRRLDRQSLYEPDEMRLVRIRADYFVYYRAH